MVQLGLSWWQAWICVWIGYGFVAPFIAMNARPGAVFHVTFPVVARTSFGVYGSLWCTFNRGAMAWCVAFRHSCQNSVIYPYFACAMQCVVRRAGKYRGRLCEGPPSRNVAQRQ